MDFFSSRRAVKAANKWHKNVTKAVREARPASSGSSYDQFPYAALDGITKEYLGKKKRSETEQNELLQNLIKEHPSKEVAFAACVSFLSVETVRDLLDNTFTVDPTTFDGLEAYLHAFVAAQHSKEGLAHLGDRRFAIALFRAVEEDGDRTRTARVARQLLAIWNSGAPFDGVLFERAQSFTRRVFFGVDSDLSLFKTQLFRGIVDRPLLDQIFRVHDVISSHGEPPDWISSCISCWDGWACWKPNKARFLQWDNQASKSVFGCVIGLEGPDMREGIQHDASVRHNLVRTGQLIPWLESKGFKLGCGLIVSDSEELLVDFLDQLLDCILLSIQHGLAETLPALIQKLGLDEHALQVWRAAVKHLEPQFLAVLLESAESDPKDLEILVSRGLQTLATDVTNSVRSPFRREIVGCVERATENLLSLLHIAFTQNQAWIDLAKRLWTLRSAVSQARWLHKDLYPGMVAICTGQSSSQSLSLLSTLHDAIAAGVQVDLQACFQIYVQSFVFEGGATADENTAIPNALHRTWLYSRRDSVRYACLRIASLDALDVAHRLQCIKGLQLAPHEAAQDLQDSLTGLSRGDRLQVLKFIITIKTLQSSSKNNQSWRDLFICITRQHSLQIDGKELMSLGYANYSQCIENIRDIVGDRLHQVQATHLWLDQLRPVESALTKLEAVPGSESAIQCIFVEREPSIKANYLKMLHYFDTETDQSRKALVQELILVLRRTNSEDIVKAVLDIFKCDKKEFMECEDLMKQCNKDRDIATIRLFVRLRLSKAGKTEVALKSLANVLNLSLDQHNELDHKLLQIGRKDFAVRVAALVARAQQLHRSQAFLRQTDPDGVKQMVAELGIEAPSGIATLTADLPAKYTDMIKETSDEGVELQFRLAEHLNATECWAFGLIEGDEILSVHLQLCNNDQFGAFCVHIHDGRNKVHRNHKYYKASTAPDGLLCGKKLTRLSYVISRCVWKAVYERGETSLKVLYEGIQAVLQQIALRCMVCWANIGAQLHRPTICSKPSCKQTYLKSPLDLRLEEVRRNGLKVDLCLASTFGAANVNNLALLPNCPPRINDAAKLQILLNTLPLTTALANAPSFQTGLKGCGQRAELLLSYLLTNYRGFLSSATGKYHLSSVSNNILQFIVVDNPPEIEAAFAQHDHYKQRHVLFHGTSIDRLYAILTQGLKILSRTNLQAHGAVHGTGIYASRTTNTAMQYTKITQTSRNFNGFYNSRTEFRDAKVLLGLEHAGDDTGSAGNRYGSSIHVITDPTRLILRYIFIVPPNVNVPDAVTLKPEMLKVFQSLRTSRAARTIGGDGTSGGSSGRCSVM